MTKKLLAFQHVEREHPSNIANFARDHGMSIDIVRLWENQEVPEVSGYSAIVVMGGSMGVYEDYPGRDHELAALKKYAGKIPILGICLGAQLLAHALGSDVYPHKVDGKRVKEVGYSTVKLTEAGKQSPLFKGFESPMTVLQWHGDTFDFPEGAELLATNTVCRNQAFSKGNSYGIQFHLEVTPVLVAAWVAEDNEWAHTDFDMDDAKTIADAERLAPLMKEQCYTLMDNFLGA